MAAFKIIWSPKAQKTYNRIADFILKKWTKKEVKKFNDITVSTILKISKNPELFVTSKQKRNIRKGFITKHTSLLYKIKPTEIELLYFWDNRQNPKKLKL
ncbi:MAG: type II toxin-antitoxin system RelE/ParE family toxin [Bacteroidota bacterium]